MKIPPSPERPTLDALIASARQIKMSPEDWFEQRVSFVYGQLPHDSKMTKDEVRDLLRRDFGRTLADSTRKYQQKGKDNAR